MCDAIDHEHWLVVELDVLAMLEEGQQIVEVLLPLLLITILLTQQDIVIIARPALRPAVVV